TADTPVPDGQRDAFELSLQIPEEAADSTLYFPTVQTCEEGETAWVQIPDDGQDAHDLESPAPSVEVVAAEEADAPEDGGAVEVSAEGSNDQADSSTAADTSPLVGLSLGIGSIGLVVAVTALQRGRKNA